MYAITKTESKIILKNSFLNLVYFVFYFICLESDNWKLIPNWEKIIMLLNFFKKTEIKGTFYVNLKPKKNHVTNSVI